MRFPKCFKNSLASLLALSTLFLSVGFAEAKNSSQNQVIEKSYDFPVKPGSKEWKKLDSKEEKLKLTQIPENDLKNLSTSALVETVLNYPLLVDMFAFDSYEEGFKAVRENFNGLAELVKREDAGTSLIQAYNELKSSGAKEEAKDDTEFKLTAIKRLLAQSEFESKLTPEEKKSLQADEKSEKSLSGPVQYVTTPNGTRVQVLELPEELNDIQKDTIAKQFKASYPNAVLLSPATSVYNCHTYAWYNQSTNNTYWMSDPSAYWKDGSYSSTTNPSLNDKIYYSARGEEHTGVITERLAGPPIGGDMASLLTVTSKWGKGGLYRHKAKDCPYYVSESALAYYTR